MNYDKCVCQGSTRTQGFCCKNGLHSNTADGCAVEEGKYTISGKVTKQGTNSPVYGAVVTLTSKGRSYQSLPTSTSGTYAISAVEPGKYSVSVAAWCYEEKNLETNIYRNEEINFEIKQMQNFPVTGFVTDKETGDAIKDATVTFGDSFSIKTNNQGKFTKSAVCEGEYQVKASAEGYGTNRTNVRVTQRTTVTFELSKVQCYYPDLRPSPTLLDVAHARAEKLTITWENDCEPEDFTIYRCEGEDCNSDYDPVSGKLSPDTTEFEDTTVKPNTHYCYVVSAFYLQDEDLFGSGIHNSQKKCMATGDELCMKTDTEQFCVTGDNDVSWVSSCNADNEVEKEINCREDEPYGEDFVCMGPDDFGDAHCRYKSKCVQCGTPFSMFSTKSFGSVPYGKRDIPQVCQQIPYCYYDYSDTTADQFYECQGIESCYDYRSQKACEEDDTAETIQNNKCLNRNCTWNPDPRYGALGVGICAEKDEEFQNCSLCDNEDGSNMFRKCDRTTCDLYGDCYYDASEPTCRNKRDMACIYYVPI